MRSQGPLRNPTRILACVVLTAVGLVTAAGTALHWSGGSSRLDRIPDLFEDIGSVPTSSVVRHVFRLRNRTGNKVHVKGLSASCSCTVVSRPPSSIDAGETVEIPLEVHTGTNRGLTSWTVTVEYERFSPTALVLQATLYEQVPQAIGFENQKRGQFNDREFRVYPGPHRTIAIRSIDYDRRYFSISHASEVAGIEGAKVTLRLADSIPDGGFDKRIRLTTSDTENNVKYIGVSGWVLRRLETVPREANFGFTSPRQSNALVTQVRLVAPYGTSIAFVGASAEGPHMVLGKVHVASSNPTETARNELNVELSLDPSTVNAPLRVPITLRARVDDKEEVLQVDGFAGALRNAQD